MTSTRTERRGPASVDAVRANRFAAPGDDAPRWGGREVFVGDDEEKDQVPLKKLQRHMLKFPRNYKKDEVYSLSAKLDAIDATTARQAGLPKGPMPKQAQNMSGMNRRMRRAQERQGK